VTLYIFGFISLPLTRTLARHYPRTVLNGNLEAAVALAGSEAVCQRAVWRHAETDIAQFGGAEVRDVTIGILFNTGSDDEIQFAIVECEFRKPGQTEWQYGEVRIMTDYSVPGIRHICGNFMH
jgi:hypothetical protein